MATLAELLDNPGVRLDAVTMHLDKLNHTERIGQVVALNKKQQMKLWDIAERSRPMTLEYLVPKTAGPLEAFPFEGKNSLPLFTRFQKVFYLDHDGNVCGYNNQKLSWFTGPGYYVTQLNPKAEEYELQVDYTRPPKEHPAGWPEIKSNDVFPSMFIYGGTRDNLRWVSKDVVIGRAFKMGEDPMPNWFVLCRAQPAPSE